MKKIKLTILAIFFISLLIIVFIFNGVSKVDIDEQSKQKQSSLSEIENKIKSANLEKENTYLSDITNITDEYELLISKINSRTENEDLVNTDKLIQADELEQISNISSYLSNIQVPQKYKNFHLLLSQSVFNLSLFSKTSDPEKIVNGIKLFQEAKEEYDKLSYI